MTKSKATSPLRDSSTNRSFIDDNEDSQLRPSSAPPTASGLILDVESGSKTKDSARTRKSSAYHRRENDATSGCARISTKQHGQPSKVTRNGSTVSADLLKIWDFVMRGLQVAVLKDTGGASHSPEVYDFMQAVGVKATSSVAKLSFSMMGLVGTPLIFYDCIPASTPAGLLQAFATFWDGCLLMSSSVVFATCLLAAFFYAITEQGACCQSTPRKILRSTSLRSKAIYIAFHSKSLRFHRIAFCVMLFHVGLIGVVGPWTLIFPGWIWHPFLWGKYEVYWPSKLAGAMQGLCVDYSLDEGKNGRLPLCLTNDNWDALSTGALSSRSPEDVEAVLEGILYGKQQSGGIVVSILARDVVDFVGPLRQNVESLVPFFSNVAVVVFENDSQDGSREAFRRWKSVVKGYRVDLIECADAVDCKFGKTHRDDVGDFAHSSAIGDMHKYRQRVVEYVLGNSVYKDYSHLIVLDIDLGVSISPLGVLHSLGRMPDNPVASVGRQPWPTAFGSLITPYDFSAFRPHVMTRNARLAKIHKGFCNLMPEGDRWRNECDAFSPIQMIEVLSHDRMKTAFVRVESAFNGAVMYPLSLIRDSKAKYDAGEDGQRCEHIGFNLSLKKPMYMNHKWDMHLSPSIPGGPNGQRAQKTASRILFTPWLSAVLQVIHFGATAVFVWSSMGLGAFFFFPLIWQGGLRPTFRSLRKKRVSAGVKTI